jgi:hypothetical protein
MLASRCAAHPSRLAVDTCPVCRRPRCGADQLPEGGCAVCQAAADAVVPSRPEAPPRELLVRGALAGYGTAIAWAYVTAEYVGAGYFQYFSPALLGILCAGAAMSAAGSPRRGVLAQRIRYVGAVCALLGAGLGFMLEETYQPLSSHTDVLVPYVIAVAAAWLWNAPPKAKKKAVSR